MSNSTKENLPIDWRSIVAGAVLGSLITGGIFVIPSAVVNNSWSRWSNWTGFGEDTITKKSTERTGGEAGPISKVTFTDEPQPGKTLWDFLGLAGVWAVPILLFILGVCVQARDRKRAEEQAEAEKSRADKEAKLERDIADDRLRDEALQTYINSMADLLLNHREELLSSKTYCLNPNNPAQNVAHIRTVTILRRLENDTERQARVLNFLRDAKLLRFLLKDAELSNVNLSGANLGDANLSGANLSGANLRRANLRNATLTGAILIDANLENANLENADLHGIFLCNAILTAAILIEANLTNADLRGANLEDAKLVAADLISANKVDYCLWNEDRWHDKLISAKLRNLNLSGVNLKSANLSGANLEDANLEDARNIEPAQVKAAQNWEKAYYSPEFRQQVGLPSKTSENNESNS
jgi:uncharacterized protein YjbI with pentapeptide repeats